MLVTGGTFSEFSVTRYNRDGVINDPDLPYLSSGRWSHACAKYLNDQQETVKAFIDFYLLLSSPGPKPQPSPTKFKNRIRIKSCGPNAMAFEHEGGVHSKRKDMG